MEKSQEDLEKFGSVVEKAQDYLKGSDDLASAYVTQVVSPELEKLYPLIEKRHKVDEPNEYVIHYTSVAALVSMLQKFQNLPKSEEKSSSRSKDTTPLNDLDENKGKPSLRLYDSVHLNDPDEGNYLIRKIIPNLPKKYDWLLADDWLQKEGEHAYVASFVLPDAEKDMSDNLVFWRTYGKEGEGCSLSLPVPRNQLKKVLYGAEEVECTAKILSPILDSLSSLVKIRQSVREELARVIRKFLEKIRYLYKSEAYKYENECRFVLAKSDIRESIYFEYQDRNDSPGRIRHYYEPDDLKLEKLLLSGSEITLGPCVPYAGNVRYSLKTLMHRARLYGPEIKISKIPYRKS